MSETLIIRGEHIYIDKILTLIKELPIENIERITVDSQRGDNHKAFGIMKNRIKDPVAWQENLREENERELDR
jgi:hypothetical protein